MTNKATSADEIAEGIINLIIKPSIHPIEGFKEGAAGFLIAKELGSYAEAKVKEAMFDYRDLRDHDYQTGRNSALEEAAKVAENSPCTCGVWSGVVAEDIRQLKAPKDGGPDGLAGVKP
jgi:hypothetical protein